MVRYKVEVVVIQKRTTYLIIPIHQKKKKKNLCNNWAEDILSRFKDADQSAGTGVKLTHIFNAKCMKWIISSLLLVHIFNAKKRLVGPNPIQSPDVSSTSKPRPRKHFYTCLSSICGSQYNLSELYMYDFPNPCVQFTFSIYLEPVNFSWVQYSKLKLN